MRDSFQCFGHLIEVACFRGHEIAFVAVLDDLAVFHDVCEVHVVDHAHVVGDYDGGLALSYTADGVVDEGAGDIVQGTSCFI